MPSRANLHWRVDAHQAVGGDRRRRVRVDWSLVTDAELDRLEALAMQAESCPDAGVFRAALAPDDRMWLDAISGRFGIVLAVGGNQL